MTSGRETPRLSLPLDAPSESGLNVQCAAP